MSKLFGHGHILQSLADGVRSRRLSHAYLFEGAEGIGKMTTVHQLSRLLLCKKGGDCGVCDHCLKLKAGSHPDFIVADENYFLAEKVKPGSVDAMRILRQDAYSKPFMGEWKLFVIPHADEMLEPAQNSLLKILEEPPYYCVFVLLCKNAGKVLETVRSRSVLLRFLPLDDEDMAAFLRSRYDENKAAKLLRPSGGIPGRALQIAEDESFLPRRETASELFCLFFEKGDLLPLSTFFEKEKDLWEEIIDGLIDLTAEAIECSACGKGGSSFARRLSNLLDLKSLLRVFDVLQRSAMRLRGDELFGNLKVNFSLAVTDLLCECLAAGKENKNA